ncbi:MAG: hypothetical protein MUC54_05285 [Chloroflexi bacterium]|jgi:hypothetical protein|nr:hypothetical protein [Chloroflexota bacterium]
MGSAIVAALEGRDAPALAAFMGPTHVIGYWASEGLSLPRAEAAALLFDELGPGDSVAAAPDVDPAMVAGPSWEQLFGPDVDVAAAFVVRGLGPTGTGAAVIYLVASGDDELTWYGTLVNRTGHV